MHGPHRLRCQHAQSVDVTAVYGVIAACFGSAALTPPLTDLLPWAIFVPVVGCGQSCMPMASLKSLAKARRTSWWFTGSGQIMRAAILTFGARTDTGSNVC